MKLIHQTSLWAVVLKTVLQLITGICTITKSLSLTEIKLWIPRQISLSLISYVMKSPLVRLKIDKSCLTEWIDWSDTGTRGTGAIGHFDSGGLPWLINDRDESEAPLFVFSVHKCSCTSHTQDPPRCSWMSFLIEWNVLSLIQLKKKKNPLRFANLDQN